MGNVLDLGDLAIVFANSRYGTRNILLQDITSHASNNQLQNLSRKSQVVDL